MISIDTNVLLRYLLQDDSVQSRKSNKLFEADNSLLITDVVITETMWTLKGKKYKLKKEELLLVIDNLFKEPNVQFENGHVVWRALNEYRQTVPIKVGSKKKDADFADALIVEKSKNDCKQKKKSFDGLYTFDKAARQINGTKEPN